MWEVKTEQALGRTGETTKPPTVLGRLEGLIDTALGHGCKDFDSFLATLKAEGVEVKRGKHLAFKIPNGKRLLQRNRGSGQKRSRIGD